MQRRAFLASLGVTAATAGVASAKSFSKPPTSPALDRWRQTLAGARLYQITRLREYSAAGRFPQNHRIFGQIPVFIDEHGTHCAVGYLMHRSGAGAIAADVARTNNHVYVERIGGGPALDWILFSGLTQAECAYIQPSYNWRPPVDRPPVPVPIEPPTQQQRLRTHFAAVEQQLLRNTNASLDAALARLAPLIEKGASLDRVAR
jgi:hypothetical protein